MIGGELEGEAGGRVVLGDDDPVSRPVRHRQPEDRGVELGQRSRVGAVDDHVVTTTNHAVILADRSMTGFLVPKPEPLRHAVDGDDIVIVQGRYHYS